MSEDESEVDRICSHCKMPIRIRNPSGFCDHLQYPEYCSICSKEMFTPHYSSEEADDLLLDVLQQACNTDAAGEILDNLCISAYEDACEYLCKKGLLIKINDRAYSLKKEKEGKL